MATAIQDLDFVAPRDCELAWTRGTLSPPIRAGERVRYFGRGEGRGWELSVGAGHNERVLIMNCWDSDIGQQLAALRDARAAPAPESFPDRVLRVAREAGYLHFAHPLHFPENSVVAIRGDATKKDIVDTLRSYAGTDNQPEAVRARKATRALENTKVATMPGEYVELLFAGSPCPGVSIAPRMVQSVAEADELYGKHGAVASAARREFGCTVRLVEIETPRDAMISAILARQVAAGGVDTEGTRHEAERWCAMLAGCVCEGMRATTDRGRESGPGIAVDKTPGPHEGATAWASATWEEL